MANKLSSTSSVIAALLGNGFVAVIKFVAFFFSGSGAMLSEAIHSAADTGNQALLYLGLKRSTRAQDADYHYGYGGERFIFGLLSASGIFFVGCGVTLYHGIHSLLHPRLPEIRPLTFIVLGVSFVIEASVLAYAVRAVWKKKGTSTFWGYLRERGDPAEVAIVLEDSAAVLGLALAALGIMATHLSGEPAWDAVATLIVGVILGLVAVFLVLENRELLLGAAVPKEVEERFLGVLMGWPSVEAVHDLKTRQLTPEAFIFKAELKLRIDHLAKRMDGAVQKRGLDLEGAGRPEALRAVSQAAVYVIGSEIDAIEAAILAAIPEARHIDLEVEHLVIRTPSTAGIEPPQT